MTKQRATVLHEKSLSKTSLSGHCQFAGQSRALLINRVLVTIKGLRKEVGWKGRLGSLTLQPAPSTSCLTCRTWKPAQKNTVIGARVSRTGRVVLSYVCQALKLSFEGHLTKNSVELTCVVSIHTLGCQPLQRGWGEDWKSNVPFGVPAYSR